MNVPFVLSSLLIQFPLMMLLPIALGWWIRRKFGVGWGVFWAGALTFVFSQVVHLPLNYALGLLGGGRGVAIWPPLPMALIAGLSAAVCEEGARWLMLTFVFKRIRAWAQGLQYGAGHGGIEAIIFGLLALINLIAATALLSAESLPGLNGATTEQLRAGIAAYWAAPWYLPIVGGLERVFAMTLQIAMALLVVRSVAQRQVGYLFAAIALHTAVDAWAVYAVQTWGIAVTEIGVAAFAALALWLIFRLRDTASPAEFAPSAVPPLTSADVVTRALNDDELARRIADSKYE